MPLKNGRLTPKERTIAQAIADTDSRKFAQLQAGVTKNGVEKALNRPEVQSEVARIQRERLYGTLLPLAVGRLEKILASDVQKGSDHIQAAKLVMSYTLGANNAEGAKDLHEMNAEELAEASAKARLRAAALEREQAERATPVKATIMD